MPGQKPVSGLGAAHVFPAGSVTSVVPAADVAAAEAYAERLPLLIRSAAGATGPTPQERR